MIGIPNPNEKVDITSVVNKIKQIDLMIEDKIANEEIVEIKDLSIARLALVKTLTLLYNTQYKEINDTSTEGVLPTEWLQSIYL